MSRLVRFNGVGWLRKSVEHVAQSFQQISRRIRGHHEPSGHDRDWSSNGLIGSGFFWQGAQGSYGYREGRTVELNSDELVSEYLRGLVVVPDFEFHGVCHQNPPIGTVQDCTNLNNLNRGVES